MVGGSEKLTRNTKWNGQRNTYQTMQEIILSITFTQLCPAVKGVCK